MTFVWFKTEPRVVAQPQWSGIFCGCLSKGGLKRGLKGGCEGVKGAKVTGEGAV